jgi:hypothetical protein
MVNFQKTTYEVWMKDGSMITSVAPNRLMAVVYVVIDRLEGDDSNIDHVSIQGGKRKLKYPFPKKIDFTSRRFREVSPHRKGRIPLGAKDEFAPPLPEHGGPELPTEPCAEEGEGARMKMNMEAIARTYGGEDRTFNGTGQVYEGPIQTSTLSGTDQFAEAKKVAEEYEVKLQAAEREVDALRENLSVGASDELKKMMEFGQSLFNQDVVKDLVASNEHLREENIAMKDKMKSGVALTILPGGHVVLIYGGRVLELSDLPPEKGV